MRTLDILFLPMLKSVRLTILFCICFFSLPGLSFAADGADFSVRPKTDHGRKWRIGYYQGGDYPEYKLNLIATVNGLADLGWIDSVEIPLRERKTGKALWNWLSRHTQSHYIQFVNDAFYSADWDENLRADVVDAILTRLNKTGDIDLMLVLGTWAGLDLANDRHHTPTLSMSVSDPVRSGVTRSPTDSGYDHVHVRTDPQKHYRELKTFHDLVGFKKLGIAYTDTPVGRSYAGLDAAERISEEKNFDIVKCFTTDDNPNIKKDEESVIRCFNELSAKADAVYITMQNGVNDNSLPELVDILNRRKIPSFSQSGTRHVEAGVLMSFSPDGYNHAGKFWAEAIAKIFNGATPRALNQVFEDPVFLAVNIKTAEIINFNPPIETLAGADKLFETIPWPQNEE